METADEAQCGKLFERSSCCDGAEQLLRTRNVGGVAGAVAECAGTHAGLPLGGWCVADGIRIIRGFAGLCKIVGPFSASSSGGRSLSAKWPIEVRATIVCDAIPAVRS